MKRIAMLLKKADIMKETMKERRVNERGTEREPITHTFIARMLYRPLEYRSRIPHIILGYPLKGDYNSLRSIRMLHLTCRLDDSCSGMVVESKW